MLFAFFRSVFPAQLSTLPRCSCLFRGRVPKESLLCQSSPAAHAARYFMHGTRCSSRVGHRLCASSVVREVLTQLVSLSVLPRVMVSRAVMVGPPFVTLVVCLSPSLCCSGYEA